MSVKLKDLIGLVAHLNVTLVAGANGLQNPVTWIQVIESPDPAVLLEGDELCITTGICLSGIDELLPLIQTLDQKHIAAIMINEGPYIEKVPQSVLDYCNQHELACFTVPWDIRISEIMRILCYAITKQDQKSFQQSAAFKNAIFFPKQTELYLVQLSEFGFDAECPFTVCVVQIPEPGANMTLSETIDKLTFSLSYSLSHGFHNFSIFSYNSNMIVVLTEYDNDQIRKFISSLRYAISQQLNTKKDCIIGVGKTTKSARCLYKSYRQAISVCKLQRLGVELHSIYYSDMGLYKLLMNIEDRDVLQDFYGKTISPLEEYDRTNRANLIYVLESYLSHNCSIKDTADALYIHRNTVTYRLNKIADLTSLNLSDQSVRLQLSVGLMLKKIIS